MDVLPDVRTGVRPHSIHPLKRSATKLGGWTHIACSATSGHASSLCLAHPYFCPDWMRPEASVRAIFVLYVYIHLIFELFRIALIATSITVTRVSIATRMFLAHGESDYPQGSLNAVIELMPMDAHSRVKSKFGFGRRGTPTTTN